MADGMPQDSITLVLKKPLETDGRSITEITIKEPTAGQMAMAEQSTKGATDQGIFLLGLVTGLHPTIIKSLAGSDYVKAQKALGSFFEDGPDIGANG